MVKKLFLFIAILCSVAFAAEFSASVSNKELALNHSLILKLKLSDATAKSTPDFSKLKDFFDIVATGQYSSTTIINAKSSTVTEWNLTLKAKKEGNVTIPVITVDTSSGKISTKELTVKIAPAKPLSFIDKNSGIFVESSVDNKKPYKFEPFFYTIKLYTKYDVKNVIFSPLELADVSVKPNGSYNIYPDKYKGEPVNVIELSYVITPLNSGQITIPGTKITGVYTTHHGMGIASLFDSIFESDQRSMTVTNSEEFIIESKESQIEVLAPAANITPWLPAKSVSLKEDMNKGDLMVGKPITRTITITANGLRGNQLPSIASDLIDSEDYKIYAEIPEITDKIEKKIITSSRKESYTIIPQKSGKITLPSVDVKWWNVKQSKLEHATLPAKTLQIMPGAIVDNVAAPKIQETDLDVPRQKIITEPDNFSLYFLLALLGVGGLFVIYRFTKLRPNIEWLSKYRTDITTKNKTENLNESPKQFRDLNSVSSVKELHEFLKYYAHCNLNLPPNSSLEIIFSTIKDNSSNIKEEHYRQLLRKLEGALYANQDCDIAEIRRECLHFLKLAKKDKKQKIKKNESKLPKLNPVHP